jgi:hypothetical protein
MVTVGHVRSLAIRIGVPESGRRECARETAARAALGDTLMKTIRAYSLESEADLARIALEGANIPAVVVGIGIGMKGGVLLVPEDRVDAALKVLKDLEERR